MANSVTFEPDFAEEIRVVHDFDKRLKDVQSDIIRDAPPSNDKNNNQTNSNAQNAFDVLMRKANTQANSKVPSKLDETAQRFTGDVLHGKAFVRLQMSCTTHIEFAYYCSSVGKLDLCAQCVSPDTTKDPELLKKFKNFQFYILEEIQRNRLLIINLVQLI
ncbi:uncharacterized protein LOC143049956 [Mytilus galloprovincialis]|uniref:uncharacterized protein LOC143049956 n=1 Tax=Mytilus galloprovincialis TaxID=29158 RepID=UPI003F7BDE4E